MGQPSSGAESIKRSFQQDLDERLIWDAAALGFFARTFQQCLWQLDGDRLLTLLGSVQRCNHLSLELLGRHGVVRIELMALGAESPPDHTILRLHLPPVYLR